MNSCPSLNIYFPPLSVTFPYVYWLQAKPLYRTDFNVTPIHTAETATISNRNGHNSVQLTDIGLKFNAVEAESFTAHALSSQIRFLKTLFSKFDKNQLQLRHLSTLDVEVWHEISLIFWHPAHLHPSSRSSCKLPSKLCGCSKKKRKKKKTLQEQVLVCFLSCPLCLCCQKQTI